MNRLTVPAEELKPGDTILIPRCVVQRVHAESTHIGVITEDGYPVMYRRGSVVGIMRKKAKA